MRIDIPARPAYAWPMNAAPKVIRQILLFAVLALVVASLASACDLTSTCPYDGQPANSTGERRCADGVHCFAEYRHETLENGKQVTHTF